MPTSFIEGGPFPVTGRLIYKVISLALMSHGRLPRLPLLGLLLIVATIQGITPDAHDLASMQPFRVFARMLPCFGTFVQEDEWPDDVCAPVTSTSAGNRIVSRRLDQGYSPYYAPIMAQSQPESINAWRFRARSRPDYLTSFAKPLCAIGCLLC
jgi:hypothetical protein